MDHLAALDELCNDHPRDEPSDDKILKMGFNYHGSKGRSVKQTLPHLPESEVFCDVFGGSGIITLNKRPSKKLDVYNDRWSGLVNFFRVVRDHVKGARLVEEIKMMEPSKELFYECKQWEVGDDVEQAARWYYMIQCSYGSLGRNWGYSRSTFVGRKYLNGLKCFPQIRLRFQNVQIENCDFREMFSKYDGPNTVFYCDPPYINSHQAGSYIHVMSEQDHYDLLACAHEAQGYVAIAHRPNQLYDKQPWDRIEEWTITGSNHGAQTESNHRIGAQVSEERIERLYIKDFA